MVYKKSATHNRCTVSVLNKTTAQSQLKCVYTQNTYEKRLAVYTGTVRERTSEYVCVVCEYMLCV